MYDNRSWGKCANFCYFNIFLECKQPDTVRTFLVYLAICNEDWDQITSRNMQDIISGLNIFKYYNILPGPGVA
jgi:hypothetical protein